MVDITENRQSPAQDEVSVNKAIVHNENLHSAAERGHAATDQYEMALINVDKNAEARLRLKIDLYVVPTVAVLDLFCFIDRANIGNARLAGFEKDLALKGYDYNTVLSLFYIRYIIFESPCNMACKYLGPGWFIPSISPGFGVVTVGFAFVRSFSAACGVRFSLGLFEAGILPGIAYYMSRWYRRTEIAFRLSMYNVMAPLACPFGGLLASAILTLDHFGSTRRWEMIFVIEGIVTIGLSLIAFFTLTDRPETARWLTQEEKDLAIALVKPERVGATEVLDKIDTTKTLHGICSPVTLATSFIFLLDIITVQGLAFFGPTIVRRICFSTTSHSSSVHCLRFLRGFLQLPQLEAGQTQYFFIMNAPLIMTGYVVFLASESPNIRYGATFLIATGAFAFGALCNAQVSANVVSDTARSSAIGT